MTLLKAGRKALRKAIIDADRKVREFIKDFRRPERQITFQNTWNWMM